MPAFSFTLFVEGIDLRDDDRVDALFEAGCGDALAGLVDGVGRLDFDREAASLEEAVRSAAAGIESVDGAKAVRAADIGIAYRVRYWDEDTKGLVCWGDGSFVIPFSDVANIIMDLLSYGVR